MKLMENVYERGILLYDVDINAVIVTINKQESLSALA